MNIAKPFGALVVIAALMVSATAPVWADGGTSGKGGSSSGPSTTSKGGLSGSGSSGSGSSGSGSSGSGSGPTTVPDGGDDTPTTIGGDVRPSVAPTTVAPSPVSVEPTSTPGTVPGPRSTPVPTSPTSKAARQFTRTTTCGSQALRVDIQADGAGLRVRTTVDKSSVTWRAVVWQDRRLAWSGEARKGRVDRVFVDLPGPETLTVRLTNTQGVVCAADLQLPG